MLLNKISCSWPEKSLPPKKKAKIKKTGSGFDNTMLVKNKNCILKEKVCIEFQTSLDSQKDFSDSDEPLSDKVKRSKKTENCAHVSKRLVYNFKRKVKNTTDRSDIKKLKAKEYKNFRKLENREFSSIYELIHDLKKCRIINISVWQLLLAGLKEMNVDVFEEIRKKMGYSSCSSYSPQLKSLALILYFKQPGAFNHMAKLYKNGWPSLDVIKKLIEFMLGPREINNARGEKNAILELSVHENKKLITAVDFIKQCLMERGRLQLKKPMNAQNRNNLKQ